MDPITQAISLALSIGTILLQISIVLCVLLFTYKRERFLAFVRAHYIKSVFVVSLIAIVTSLFYSGYVGFLPCSLCWYQRIFIYPQFILAAIALARGYAREIADYSLWLSIFGGMIAAYNYYGQMFNTASLPCATGGAASCAIIPFTYFGYVTIPMMSLAAFTTLALLAIAYKKSF